MAFAGNDVRVAHFDEGSCPTTMPCTCNPSWVSAPFTLTGSASPMSGHRSLLMGSTLYVVGWAQKTATDFEAYVAQLDLASHAWGPMYIYDPTAAFDAFVNIVSDGTKLYVSGVSGYDGATFSSAAAHVFVLPIPLVANSTPTIIDVPQLRVGWSLDLDATGMVLTGVSATADTDGRTVRCTRTSCL
jgi:hypothetical protein